MIVMLVVVVVVVVVVIVDVRICGSGKGWLFAQEIAAV